MRCPACTQRNSVAANKCKFCGAKFKRRTSPTAIKITAGVVAVAVLLGIGSAVSSMFSGKPEPKLKPIAERMAAGPKSPEDAHLMRAELDAAVVKYLEQHGSLSSPDLLTKLQSEVPSTAFEVLVFDLPNKMKLIEMTCVLQPSDYLVVPTTNGGAKVSRIAGLSVFDDSRLIAASPDPVLVLLGHTTGDKPKQPQINALTVLPSGEISDRSDKLVPPIKGSGSASFVGTSNDIKVERFIVSSAKDQGLFDSSVNFKDEPFITTLTWKNGRYDTNVQLGTSEVGALYAVANSLVDPSEADIYRQQLSSEVRENLKAMESKPVGPPGNFKIGKVAKESSRRKRSRRGGSDAGSAYLLTTGKRAFEVGLVKAGRWSATSLKETGATETVATEPVAPDTTTTAAVAPTPEPAQEAKIIVHEPETPKQTTKIASTTSTTTERAKKPEPKAEKPRSEKPREEKKTETKRASGGRLGEIARRVTMRTGPARQNEQIMDLSKGEQVRIIGEQGSWYKVSVNGREGWIYNSYVKKGSFNKSDVPTVAAKKEPPAPKREKKEKREEKRETASKPAPAKSSTTASKPAAKTKKTQISTSKPHHVDRVDHTAEPDFVP